MRIDVDIGGTVTDLVSLSPDGAILTRKVPSTTDDYARGIATALTDLFVTNQLRVAAITLIIHGTTIATNAILQHQVARTGLITTQGFRDVLELRRLRIEYPLRITRYALVQDACGAGRFRGGLAVVRDYRALRDDTMLQVRSDA